MSKGYVYILSNPSMPGLLKIGKTTRDVNARADELYQTGVPTPFQVQHSVFSPDCHELERMVHQTLEASRLANAREFFTCDLRMAECVLNERHTTQVEDMISDFMPDNVPVNADLVLDEGFIAEMCFALEAQPPEVVTAINMMTWEEIAPAFSRYQAKIAKWKMDRAGAGVEVVTH